MPLVEPTYEHCTVCLVSTEHIKKTTRLGPRSVCVETTCTRCGRTTKRGMGAPYDPRYDPELTAFDPEDEDLPTPDVW